MSGNREQFRPADHPHDHFLLTTVVGSYPKPRWLEQARNAVEDGHLDEEAWEEALDDAAASVTREHERAGLDVVVDGEVRRTEMVEYFAERIGGFAFHGPVKVWGHNYFDKPSVTDAVTRDQPWLLEEYQQTARVAQRPVKIPITGPYTLAKWSFNEWYQDTAALTEALAGLVREEVEQLIEAGVTYIQIDEPALATTPDDHALVKSSLEHIVSAVPQEVRIGLHVCYGDYDRIYPEVLDFPIDELDIEQSNQGFDQLSVFRDPPFTKDLALGVIDVHDATVEPVEEIKANIEQGLSVVPPEQLTVSPDCGVKLLPRAVAFEKMENMVTAARELEEELDAGEIEPGQKSPR